MRTAAGQESSDERNSCDPLLFALASQSKMWPDVQTGLGSLEPGWITAGALFADDDAIDEYLDFEGVFHACSDRMTCAAAMMVDYCYIFSASTVPLFVGFSIVPELSPLLFALHFHTTPLDHDGRTLMVRRAHVRLLSGAFSQRGHGDMTGLDAQALLCEIYRRAVEEHFDPLVRRLHARTGLSRNALWRLVGDSIAGRFLDAGRRFGRLDEAKAAAMAILKQPDSPLRNSQLHYIDLTLHDGEQRELLTWTFRARGGCCRFYTVGRGELCSTCVLKPAAERDAELLAAMRRHMEPQNAPPPEPATKT